MELQEPNNDENTKKAKSKVKICKKNKKVIKKAPEKKFPKKLLKLQILKESLLLLKKIKNIKHILVKKD